MTVIYAKFQKSLIVEQFQGNYLKRAKGEEISKGNTCSPTLPIAPTPRKNEGREGK